MFYYKQAKTQSNYLQIPLTLGEDYQSNNQRLQLNQAQVVLTLPLFGKDQIATVSYPAGTLDGEEVMGEVVLSYTLQANQLQVCDHDFSAKGYLPVEHYHTKPFFQLTKTTEANDQASVPLLKVSSDQSLDTVKAENDELFDGTVINSVREQLRGIYDELEKELKGMDYGLSVCLGVMETFDEAGNLDGGIYYDRSQIKLGTYFYNIDDTSGDHPPIRFENNWLRFYAHYAEGRTDADIIVSSDEGKHQYCSAHGSNLTCGVGSFVGGHVFTQLIIVPGRTKESNRTKEIYSVTGLTNAQHQLPKDSSSGKYKLDSVYSLLPICFRHNNWRKYDVVMRNNENRPLIHLKHFKSTT
ncbi:hypothetical protein [Enterococcus sp. DIV0800]|uniref:hypothetical protein n=1 Tax=unclassified Enterococcus TaxID=2608891 RepID=UPI003D2FD173